jgi:hypothetical protein
VTDLRPFECERPAPTSGPQADGDDRDDDHGQPVRPVGADLRDLCVGQTTVTDQTGTDEDGDATEDRRQVRLVERVDPVDVGQPLATPDAPPIVERVLEVGVRVGDRRPVQRYS